MSHVSFRGSQMPLPNPCKKTGPVFVGAGLLYITTNYRSSLTFCPPLR